jgi:HPt (histidine-containing phosphotransfer) domain-containing protein
MESGLIDFNKIKEILGEEKNSLISFYDLFKEQTTLDNTSVEKFLEEKNWIEVAAFAHKLKSSYGSIGANEVANLLAGMEMECKESPEYNHIVELYKKYMDLYSIIIVEFDIYLSQ